MDCQGQILKFNAKPVLFYCDLIKKYQKLQA